MVTSLLGKGAQARVYLAWDARLRQWRAIKVLSAEIAKEDQVRLRFSKEAEAMARLTHRNLLRVLDIDSDGNLPFIVMELARAGAVTDWIKRHGAMPPHLAIDVIGQACEGLAVAHAKGVVHRDVKPHNLLVADDGRILLTDFGIAQLDEEESLTQTGSVLGTFAYMAPEQRNDTKSVDQRTDVYALGATLYTCLTLRASAELFFAEKREDILEGIPSELALVILDACRYDRDDRIQSVLELKERLDACLEGLTEVECPPLNSEVMPLPERPPMILSADSGVGDLAKMLSAHGEPEEGKAPRTRAEMLFEEQSTTLYSDTGYDDAEDFAFAEEPETEEARREPTDLGATQPSEIPDEMWAMREGEGDDPLTAKTEISGGFERTETTRGYGFHRPGVSVEQLPVRRPFAELSDEDTPGYIDVSTLDRPSPDIGPDPAESRAAAVAPAATADGPRRSPVVPPRLHTAPPASLREAAAVGESRTSPVIYVVAALLFAVTLVVSLGVLDKSVKSWQASEAAAALDQTIRNNHERIIKDIDREGESRGKLEEKWFAVEDATTVAERNQRMAEYAHALVARAQGRDLPQVTRAQVVQVRNALDAWTRSRAGADAAQASHLGRLTGSLGTFTY